MAHVHARQPSGRISAQAAIDQPRLDRLVQRGHAVVVEVAGDGAKHRHLTGQDIERFAVALHLLGHIAQRVGCAAAVELVDGHEAGEVEHVDLLELAGRAELRRHHVQRHIDHRHDGRIALADARGLDHDQIEAGHLARRDHVGQRGAHLAAGVARCQAAHVHALRAARRSVGRQRLTPRADRVHANAVTEQRATALAARRVDRDHGHAQAVVLVEPQAADQLVGQRRLAGTARAGDAEHGHRCERGACAHRSHQRRIGLAVFQCGDQLSQRTPGGFVVASDGVERARRMLRKAVIAAHHHLADHSLQPHALAVLGAVDARHAVGLQLADLVRHDDATATAKHLNVRAAALAQQVDHVLEVLDVPALVAADRDALHVFLQRGGDHLVDRAVVPEVDHLGAHAHEQSPHDVDGGIVAIEQRRCGHEAHLVRWPVGGQRLEWRAEVGHEDSIGVAGA